MSKEEVIVSSVIITIMMIIMIVMSFRDSGYRDGTNYKKMKMMQKRIEHLEAERGKNND